jgi:hypothetical protein
MKVGFIPVKVAKSADTRKITPYSVLRLFTGFAKAALIA